MPRKAKMKDTSGPVFPDLPYYDDDEMVAEVTGEGGGKKGGGDQMAEMQAKLDALTKQLEESRQTQLSLMATPQTQQVYRYQPQTPQFDTKDLPDPVEKPTEYAQAIHERTRRVLEAEQAAERARQAEAQSRTQRYNELWSSFETAYPDYAKSQSLATAAAQDVARKITAKGIDIDKYMTVNQKQFMEDVKARIDEIVGRPLGAADEEEEETETVGMLGGLESGGKTTGKNPNAPDPNSQLRKWQVDNGWY